MLGSANSPSSPAGDGSETRDGDRCPSPARGRFRPSTQQAAAPGWDTRRRQPGVPQVAARFRRWSGRWPRPLRVRCQQDQGKAPAVSFPDELAGAVIAADIAAPCAADAGDNPAAPGIYPLVGGIRFTMATYSPEFDVVAPDSPPEMHIEDGDEPRI